MIGGLIHNYEFPSNKFQFLVAPLYATGSKTLNGIGRVSYTSYPSPKINKVVYFLSGEKFSTNQSVDTLGNKVFENFSKIVPGVRLYFKHPLLSAITSSVDLRSFFIRTSSLDSFVSKAGDSTYNYPASSVHTNSWLVQLSYDYKNNRALYPYQYQLQWQQGQHFYRLNFNGNYFFNYAKGGGLNMRLFAAKFGYIGTRSGDAYLYQPKLLGVRGEEDYTYSNYFLGRSASSANSGPVANNGIAGSQIMIRDGGLKLALDQYDYLQGRSENWVAAVNFTSSVPTSIFPEKFPFKIFCDIGTYSEAWGNNPPTSRFLYTAGLQLSLLKNVLNIYMPLLYSSDFKDEIKSSYPKNHLLKTITFSIDIQNFALRKIDKNLDF